MLISEPVKISEHNNKTFQIGRTVVTIKSKSEAPWKKRNLERIEGKLGAKGAELHRMEELLRDNSLSKTYSLKQNPKPSGALPQQYPEDIEERVQKISASEKVEINFPCIEIDGKRYIILKELEDKPSEE